MLIVLLQNEHSARRSVFGDSQSNVTCDSVLIILQEVWRL